MLIKSFHLGRYISFKWQFLKISASQGLEMKHSFQLNFFFFVSRTQRNNDVLNVLLFFLLNFALIILSSHSSAMVPSTFKANSWLNCLYFCPRAVFSDAGGLCVAGP